MVPEALLNTSATWSNENRLDRKNAHKQLTVNNHHRTHYHQVCQHSR